MNVSAQPKNHTIPELNVLNVYSPSIGTMISRGVKNVQMEKSTTKNMKLVKPVRKISLSRKMGSVRNALKILIMMRKVCCALGALEGVCGMPLRRSVKNL
jgi:hypothetical protein